MNSPTKANSIFLSYAHVDEAWVTEFVKSLRAAGIHNYWFDQETFTAGDHWAEKIEDALRESETFIVFFSPNSVENPNVLFEFGAAFADNKTIIPVLIGDIDQKQIPLLLTTQQGIHADSPREAGKQVARIIENNTQASAKAE